ncbi:MAG: DUF814 domain-containing protein [Myxococcales bacterium]|nr:DUF814 domain-containing protein [Myxococcales bacterium]
MLSHAELAAVADALRPRVVGGQVQKVRAPDPHTVVLRVRRPGETVHLVLSCAPGAPRLAEADAQGPTLPEPPALVDWLRAVAAGRRLDALTLDPDDRVITLQFEGGRLVAELTGRHANLIAVDADDRVVATARRFAPGRGLGTGDAYVPPPPPPPRPLTPPRFTDPRAVEREARVRLAAAAEASAEAERARLLRTVRKRLERLRANVEADLARSDAADQWRRWGELLKTQLHRVTRGDATARVQDWYAEGAPLVEVPLDPALDGPANVERLFQRYRKARDGAEHALARLVEVESNLERLDALDAAHDDLEGLTEALRAAGLFREKAGGGGRRATTTRLPYRVFESRAGERILVGRGGADNHATTFHVARGNDLWLHVRDAPGAHVVVPLPARGRDPHPETLLDAAALAAHHSDLRGETVVDVTVTRRKHVRAVPGAGPGRVTIADARALTVTDGAERIARLYAR